MIKPVKIVTDTYKDKCSQVNTLVLLDSLDHFVKSTLDTDIAEEALSIKTNTHVNDLPSKSYI